ncbi:DUF4192 domain-containing protein [Rhizocola hellebori]|nr:DUF4192 domain-containing protein [Rhizocola hellebori]
MPSSTFRLTSREDLLGYVPYGLGFYPQESLVLVGLGQKRLELCARADASWPTRQHVSQFAQALRRIRKITAVLLLGYGGAEIADPTRAVGSALEQRGYPVMELLRVTGDRFFCLTCGECTPPEGRPFEVKASAAAAAAIFAGMVARPDRASVERLVRPIGGLAAVAMSQAVDRAGKRLDEAPCHLQQWGREAVEQALSKARHGDRLDDDEVAWLTLVLQDTEVRDHAWRLTDREVWQLELWLDLTRRAEPSLAAPLAALLSWCAWRQGDGALAMVAAARAQRLDPAQRLAQFVADLLDRASPPSTVTKWPVPL